MYILKPFKRMSVDFYCDWIRGVIEYSSDVICNAFVSSVFVLQKTIFAPELCIMLIFFRYSGRFVLTY